MAEAAQSPGRELPELVYIGDVPVASSYHGSMLLYRLLQHYPPARLLILEGDLQLSEDQRRLPDVRYRRLPIPGKRWLNTRISAFAGLGLSLGARWRSAAGAEFGATAGSQAVLTVLHGFSWITAAAYARRRQLPLHLIVHDDWPALTSSRLYAHWLQHEVRRVYVQAASRLCVSPFMAEEFQHRYGAAASVLYPSRPAGAAPRRHDGVAVQRQQLLFAYGGTINTPGYARALQQLAAALQRQGGRLNLYGPIDSAQALALGLDRPNIRLRGLLPSGEFIHELHAHADVVYVPMSFAPRDRGNMRLGFPSKLVDYTAAGVALLIHGPEDCSAVRWAMDNPGVAEVVTAQGEEALLPAIRRLADSAHRARLARAAFDTGARCFDAAVIEKQFFSALIGASADGHCGP